jgi:hypothetical protein
MMVRVGLIVPEPKNNRWQIMMTTTSIRRTISLVIALVVSLVAGTCVAVADDDERHLFRIPGTDYDVALGSPSRQPDTAFARPLLAPIAIWLSKEFALPSIQRYPEVELLSSAAINALRYKGLSPRASNKIASDSGPATPQASETVAIYSDHEQTIYLAEGWSGRTPADLSVLVHEMVHHFQNVLGLRHECPQEREKLAYMAQERWLGLFGHNLETDFELDGFSLIGKTRCFY